MSQAVTTRQLEIAAMLSRNGLYVLGNPMYTGWTGIAVVLNADEKTGTPGRLFSLVPGQELSTDPEAWVETGAFIAGGPFSVQSCEEQERIDDAAETHAEALKDELTFWRNIAASAVPLLRHYEVVTRANGNLKQAAIARALLNDITPIEEKI